MLIVLNMDLNLLGLAPLWLLLWLFCLAKSATHAALISRLAFGELMQQPEPLRLARYHTNRRFWQFLLAILLLFLVFILAYIAISLLLIPLSLVLQTSLGGGYYISGGGYRDVVLATIGSSYFLALLGTIAWLLVRLMIFDLPLAIETDLNAATTLSRAWQLTRKQTLRLSSIAIVVVAIAFPFQIFSAIITLTLQSVLTATLPAGPFSLFLLLWGIGSLVGILSSLFFLPLWQTVKATIYFDLRSRKEGLGLQLRSLNPPIKS